MPASKRDTLTPLTKEDRRTFYANRQVEFLCYLYELRDTVDRVIRPLDKDLHRNLEEVLLGIMRTVPHSRRAVVHAQRQYQGIAASRRQRHQAELARLRTMLDKETVPQEKRHTQRTIDELRNRQGRSPLEELASLLEENHLATLEAEEERSINDIAAQLLQDLDI